MIFRKRLFSSLCFIVIVAATAPVGQAPVARADSLTALQQQQAALQQQAAAAAAAAQQQQQLAERAANSLQQVKRQITSLNGIARDTQQQLASVQQRIAQKDQDIASLLSDLQKNKDQQNALLRQLYIYASSSQTLPFFSNQSISEQARQNEEIAVLEDAATASATRTQSALASVQAAKNDLTRQNDDLAALLGQQQSQQIALADAQTTQQQLQTNAVSAEAKLEAQAAAAKAAANAIAARIATLTTTKAWGTQIVSGNVGGWYYTQTGDQTPLGDGPYTVSEVGCLITSMAMVSTFYGHHVTPDYIATHASFSDGYLVSLPDIGVIVQGSRPVNWGVVNAELAAGRPVIVSIYLPSVGKVNSDGSSHYIVLNGTAANGYTMSDPIAQYGRGYNLNQVRSMRLVSNQ
jgi:hypothetical protein